MKLGWLFPVLCTLSLLASRNLNLLISVDYVRITPVYWLAPRRAALVLECDNGQRKIMVIIFYTFSVGDLSMSPLFKFPLTAFSLVMSYLWKYTPPNLKARQGSPQWLNMSLHASNCVGKMCHIVHSISCLGCRTQRT